MKKFFLFFLIFNSFLFAGLAPIAENEVHFRDKYFDYRSEDPDTTIREFSALKFSAVASLVGLSYGAAYLLVFNKGWWDDEGSHFHFENDFHYAKNLDKLGHFASGVAMGELFYEGYYWTGMSERNAYLFAGTSAFLTHVAIDVKDGYSPEWGFSVFDVLFGSLGGFYPMAKRYIPIFKYFDLKFSYWKNSDAYFDDSRRRGSSAIFTDDYCNQTYWISFKIYRFLPNTARKYYPEWLALALGISINEDVFHLKPGGKDGHYKGRYELYLALDYDLESFRPHARWARTLIKSLNYFKLPAPAIQFLPDVKFFLAYPIKF